MMPALVPGMVDAGLVALREYGTKSFAEVIAPAIELADGMPIDEMRAGSIERERRFLSCGRPRRRRSCRAAGRRSRARSSASRIWRARCASMVEAEKKALAAGANRAPPSTPCAITSIAARSPARSTPSQGATSGLLRYEDMAAFQLQPEEPVSTTYRGYTVYKPGFWSQGPAMIEALNILEGYDLRAHEATIPPTTCTRWWKR